MTRSEAVAALQELRGGGDPEHAHFEADEVLLNYLKANGGEQVAEAWEETRKQEGFWYA